MAPVTQTPSFVGRSSVNSRSPQTSSVAGQPVTENKSSTTVGTTTSTSRKQSTVGSSTRSTHGIGSSTTEKRSSTTLSTVRNTNVVSPSTQKVTVVGLQTVQSGQPGTGTVGSTTRGGYVIGGQTPGGNHPTLLPVASQGQHGTTPADGSETNTSAIVAGVLVPLILIGAGALMFYIWYRRKYPVRMVVGRDFNRFSNPAYNKRASTLTLVRHDSEKEWERINTLSRKNPGLSLVNEDEPDGIVNNAFELEKEETSEVIVEKREETGLENTGNDANEISSHEETSTKVSISRERPKTKKAVLVKTDTVEDLENAFELVTESDLGNRTESEVSSGNESTETHTISLSFSDTFDNRHKDEQTSADDKTDGDINANKNDACINIQGKEEHGEEKSFSVPNNNVKGKEADELETGVQNNEPSTQPADSIVLDVTKTKAVSTEMDLNNSNLSTDQGSEEINTKQIPEETLAKTPVNDSLQVEKNNESDIGETFDESAQLQSSELSKNAVNNAEQTDSFVLLQEIPDEATGGLHEEDVNSLRTDTQAFEIDQKDGTDLEENTLNLPKHDNSFEILSVPEDVVMRSSLETNDFMAQDHTSVLEKEKMETLEKENTTVLELKTVLHENSSAGVEDLQKSVLTADKKDLESTSAQSDTERKKPSLNLSNENIVLEAVPSTPTVFVQESFILETEAALPVYLDNINSSPARGRRAFTMNDIASKQTSGTAGFSLPKGMDEISKSSPVISELKSPEFPGFERKQFDYVSQDKKENENNEISLNCNLNKEFNDNESNDNKETDTFDDKNEEKELISDLLEAGKLPNVIAIKNNEPLSALGVSDTYPENGKLENDTNNPVEFHTENVEKFTSIDTDSSEFDHGKSRNFTREMPNENTHSNNVASDPFNVLEITPDMSPKTDIEDGKLTTDSVTLISTDTKQEDLELTIQSSNNDNGHEKEALEGSLNDDNPFLNNFPQASTPTASIVEDLVANQSDNSSRKKVLPQTFDFENLSCSDDDSETSESSSENEEIQNSEETWTGHVKSRDTFESEVLGSEKQAKDSIEDEHTDTFHKESISTMDDMLSMTRSTDSSTALSWDILSRDNSQDSSSIDHFDVTSEKENAPGLSHLPVDSTQNNDSKADLPTSSENASSFDFISDMQNDIASNTSIGSTGVTDLSWEVVNEEGDNSEC